MMELKAALMGLVEGLTEYLPVSSTGHLILAGHWTGFETDLGHEVATTFEVFIQMGAILAVAVAYPGRFAGLLDLRAARGFAGPRGISLLVCTSLPALMLGALLHGVIKDKLFAPWSVAVGLAVGAVWILVVERRRPGVRTEGLDQLGWRDAVLRSEDVV